MSVASTRVLWDKNGDEPTPDQLHWLKFAGAEITHCNCGYEADPSDSGYGDSIVEHLLQVGRDEVITSVEAVPALGGQVGTTADIPQVLMRDEVLAALAPYRED